MESRGIFRRAAAPNQRRLQLQPRRQAAAARNGASKKPGRTPERILQMVWGYAPPLIIATALNYRLFDLLDRGPCTCQQLAAQSGASARGLAAILNALVGLELLAKRGERYALTPESSAFLVSTRPSYYGALFQHTVRQALPHWLRLKEAVGTGRSVFKVDQQRKGQQFFAEFVEALFPVSYPAARAAGQALGIPKAKSTVSVLDIGAGSGVWGIALAHLSPHVKIRAVDWPNVLEVTARVARRHGVGERLQTVPGDLLKADFGRGHQVATIGHILHSEGRDKSRKLLRKTFRALAPGGTVVISEFVPNEERTGPAAPLIFAVNMLVHTDAGDTFTFKEIASWLRQAGFVKPRLLQAPAPSPLILATRP